MLELITISSTIIILSIFQTIAGIGILVIGTPIMLLAGMGMVEVMNFLLPLSIINSLLNIIYIKINNEKIKVEEVLKKNFFMICFPGVFLGLVILKNFNNQINYNILVSIVIWVVLFLSFFHQKKNFSFLNKAKKSFIFFTGIIHGISNSGGSLLSILIIETYKKNVIYLRYQIIYFYFYLAFFQYLTIIFISDTALFSKVEFNQIFSIIIGVILGNFLSNKINVDQLKKVIFCLALFTSVFLLVKN